MNPLGQMNAPEWASIRQTEPQVLFPRQRAVWIASYPKSGNTWVRVFLHNLIRELRGQGESAQSINALHEMTLRGSLVEQFARELGKSPDEATPREIAQARASTQARLVKQEGGPVFIKTHNAVALVEGFPAVNFDITLGAVYIVRNPLDVAVSYANYSGFPADHVINFMAGLGTHLSSNASPMYEFVGSWSFHTASWMSIPHRPVLLLRYEDLLTTPERSFGRLAAFLRLKPDTGQLLRAIEKSSFKELALQEERHGFIERPKTTEKFFRNGKSGQWREALSQSQVKAILDAHGPMMMRFGYLTEDSGVELFA